MFSGSTSYMGGGNSARPGQPPFAGQQQQMPYGQQQQPQYGQQPQQTGYGQQQAQAQQQQPQYGQPAQQQPFLTAQSTGFVAPLQPQYTAYPQQQQQQPPPQQPPVPQQQFPQYTAQQQPGQFQQQSQMQQQAPIPQQPTAFQQPQQPQQPQSLAPPSAPQQVSQATGMTSSQMANSFRGSSSQSVPAASPTGGSKIPNIRLSFITATDQAKFEQLFKSAVGTGQSMTGDQARDLLMRSKLTGDALAHIWTLADTTKSGHLLFPEFALAMYLCNLKLNNKELPGTLPDKVKNEVSSMVDIISFGVPDQKPLPPVQTNAPNFFDSRQSTQSPPVIQQPQPQQSNAALLSTLSAQPTHMMPQMTGYPGQAGLMPQVTGMMPSTGPHPPMPPMPTGYSASPIAPLNSQPTAMPGQWGLVNAPATGLPNIDALHRQMMPQTGREGGFTTAGLSGNAVIPWAVTKDEKRIYDDLFRSWDGFGKGYITGEQAIEIFSQSGLEKPDLERIWTLSDPSNRGRLNLDEFAVAMHLIYRKLNGYPVPNRLPAELTPPSTRNLNDSIGTVKSMLQRDAEQRKNTGAFLQPQRTGVSYLKSHSFKQGGPGGRADATVFKNNDDNVGYKSSARRRIGAGGRSPSPAQSASGSDRGDELTGDQIRKLIKEKKILLDAIDFNDENQAEEDDKLDRRDRRDADDLYRRIRRVQEDIDRHPTASKVVDGGSDAERRTLRRQLQGLTDRLPELASQVRRCERAIADAQLELFRFRDAKAHPGAAPISGTGPGGTVTESDRLKARAKALMQQRSAALAGKTLAPTGADPAAAAQRLEAESSRVRAERETNEHMVQDVEESVAMFGKSLEDNLNDGAVDSTTEHERRRWEDGLGVEDETRDFIFELQRESKSARASKTDSRSAREQPAAKRQEEPARPAAVTSRDVPPRALNSATPVSTGGASYSQYRTAEERAAYIKQQAEQRMAERLAALGIKPAKVGETAPQRAEREKREQEERIHKAEQEDAQRELERQRRLADESIAPPTVGKPAAKKPPPPPSRKGTAPAPVTKRVEALKDEQEAQHLERKRLEEEEQRQELELAKEKEAAQARLQALEQQVKQGKLRKEEEKKRRQMEQRSAKEKESRLAAQRAELETARERERQLTSQLENLGDSSSDDDEGPREITPQGTTPTTSQELPPSSAPSLGPAMPTISAPSPPVVPSPARSVLSPPTDLESKNPFLKKKQASASAGETTPTTAPPSVPATESTNPFHRLTQGSASAAPAAPVAIVDPAASRAARMRPKDDDDWSVVDESSSDEEDDGPAGGGAKQLASLLFGTMAPPRPLSAMDGQKSPPPPSSPPAPTSTAPPAPPMPGSGAPLPPGPPPAPPMPSTGAAPPPPGAPPAPPMPGGGPKASGAPSMGALLGAIKQGTGLKKVETKDRSQSTVAGRVLN